MSMLYLPRGIGMAPKVAFALLMLFISGACLMRSQVLLAGIGAMGYPPYLLNILGIGYGLGVFGILQGRYELLREWAYAGYVFAFLGSMLSHIYHDGFLHTLPTLAILTLCLAAYRFDKMG